MWEERTSRGIERGSAFITNRSSVVPKSNIQYDGWAPRRWFPPVAPSEEHQMLVYIFENRHFEVWPEGRRPQKPKIVEMREISRDAKEKDRVVLAAAR